MENFIEISIWFLGLCFCVAFVYELFFRGALKNLFCNIVRNTTVIITIMLLSLLLCWIVGTFDGGPWTEVNKWGLDMFFIWAGLILGAIVSLIWLLWEVIVSALFLILALVLRIFGIKFKAPIEKERTNFSKGVNVRQYKKVSF